MANYVSSIYRIEVPQGFHLYGCGYDGCTGVMCFDKESDYAEDFTPELDCDHAWEYEDTFLCHMHRQNFSCPKCKHAKDLKYLQKENKLLKEKIERLQKKRKLN